MIVTLLVSTGEPWEARALTELGNHPGTVVLKRCVDVDDLLATASAGQAQVAVVAADLPGLDGPVVTDLAVYGVRVVAVAADADVAVSRASGLGIGAVVSVDDVPGLVEVVAGGAEPTLQPAPVAPESEEALVGPVAYAEGRVIAVHGPAGGPGRTTLAVNLAAELAHRDQPTLLVDADPYGGAVAQQLGVLDEVSGVLSASRLVAAGSLPERFATVQREITAPLRVLTGLPRPDRWVEVRPGTVTEVVEHGRSEAHVVVDTGFSLEGGAGELGPVGGVGARPERNGTTLEALECADEILLVGAADPVGLSRLARTINEVHEIVVAARVRVVVNRMRPTLGWKEADVVAMLDGFGDNLGIIFLPEDQPAVDRALVAGRSLTEVGDSPLARAVADLADAMA